MLIKLKSDNTHKKKILWTTGKLFLQGAQGDQVHRKELHIYMNNKKHPSFIRWEKTFKSSSKHETVNN